MERKDSQVMSSNGSQNFQSATSSSRSDEQAPKVEPQNQKVALVFTDILQSTSLWEEHPQEMEKALETHYALLRKLLSQYQGFEVKSEGDSMFATFEKTSSALRWCIAVQEELLSQTWPAEILSCPQSRTQFSKQSGELLFCGPRVRMGIHVGCPKVRLDPTTLRNDFFGQDVNRAARISSAASGGQILVSGSAYKSMTDEAASDPAFSDFLANAEIGDLGVYRFRGIEQPERLIQIMPMGPLSKRKFPLPTTEVKRYRWEIKYDEIQDLKCLSHGHDACYEKGEICICTFEECTAEWKGGIPATFFRMKPSIRQRLSEQEIERMADRFSLLCEVRDPSLEVVLGACLHPLGTGLLTERSQVATLRRVLDSKEVDLDFNNMIMLLEDAARGVNHLHSEGIPHENLSLDSLKIGRSGSVQVCSFGLCFLLSSDTEPKKEQVTTTVSKVKPAALAKDVLDFCNIICEMFSKSLVYTKPTSEDTSTVSKAISRMLTPSLAEDLSEEMRLALQEESVSMMNLIRGAEIQKKQVLATLMEKLEFAASTSACALPQPCCVTPPTPPASSASSPSSSPPSVAFFTASHSALPPVLSGFQAAAAAAAAAGPIPTVRRPSITFEDLLSTTGIVDEHPRKHEYACYAIPSLSQEKALESPPSEEETEINTNEVPIPSGCPWRLQRLIKSIRQDPRHGSFQLIIEALESVHLLPELKTKPIRELKLGDHVCCIYSSEDDRINQIRDAIASAVPQKMKVILLCIDEAHKERTLSSLQHVSEYDINELQAHGQLHAAVCFEAVKKSGGFDACDIIEMWASNLEKANNDGFSGICGIADMGYTKHFNRGVEEVVVLEAGLSSFFHGSHYTCLCMYHRKEFDPTLLMNVLDAHPALIIDNQKVIDSNIYFNGGRSLLHRSAKETDLRMKLDNIVRIRELDKYFRKMESEIEHLKAENERLKQELMRQQQQQQGQALATS